MSRCPHCCKYFRSLTKHIYHCPVANQLQSTKKKRRRSPHFPKSSHKIIRQQTSTQEIESALSGDTHCAQKAIVSDQLVNIPSIRDNANQQRIQNQNNNEPIDDNIFSPFDIDDPIPNNNPKSPDNKHQKPHEQKATKRCEEDTNFINQFLKYIDPNASDPFDPEKCEEKDIEFIDSSYKKVGQLPDFILRPTQTIESFWMQPVHVR